MWYAIPILNKYSSILIQIRIRLPNMYVISILTYASTAWAPCVNTMLRFRLEAVHMIGSRMISGLPKIVRDQVLLNIFSYLKIQCEIRNESCFPVTANQASIIFTISTTRPLL